MFETVAIVGATGAVGRIMVQLLQERNFPARQFRFLASKRSAGSRLTFQGREYVDGRIDDRGVRRGGIGHLPRPPTTWPAIICRRPWRPGPS